MNTNLDMAARFIRDTKDHRIAVLHDDGLYRHIRFHDPKHGMYWFSLTTIPGTLIFQGDGESYVFSRIEDMFEFFRGPVGRINPQYWAEKVTSDRDSLVRYDQDLLERHLKEAVNEALQDDDGTLNELTDAVTSRILDELLGDESLDRDVVERFQFYADPNDEWVIPRKEPDFRFHDVWEWNCRDYDWWFLWACHAIVWGIAQFDGLGKEKAA